MNSIWWQQELEKNGEKFTKLLEGRIYKWDELPLKRSWDIVEKRGGGKESTLFYNIPVAFDIETTSMRMTELKDSYGYMYHWQMCINEDVVFGRTWAEFILFLKRIINEMSTLTYHLVIYVHNLGFEWQFMNQFLKLIDDDIKVFYPKKRMPLVIRMENSGIEFRCSWKLSNMSAGKYIENAGSVYRKQPSKKKTGDTGFDYTKIRTPQDELTDTEKVYCYCDVRGICDAIRKELEHGYDITTIPLTSTSFVRRDTLRSYQYYDKWINGEAVPSEWGTLYNRLPYHVKKKPGKSYHFRTEFKKSAIDPALYQLMKDVGRGGDTKANIIYVGKISKGVYSFDRISSYPAVQMTYKYPCGKWIRYNPDSKDTFREYMYDDNMASMCMVYLENVRLKKGAACPYIAISKCKNHKGAKCDNGKVWKADALKLGITEIDFRIIDMFYEFDIVGFDMFYRAYKDYLPIPLRAVNLFYFMNKCTLKSVDDYLYMKSKNKLNGIFGMTYTDIVHDKWLLDLETLEWTLEKGDVQAAIDKYYSNKSSCLRYDTGIYTTAYARYELNIAINAVGRKNFLYADTDSVKWCPVDSAEEQRILKWFSDKNKELTEKAIEMEAYVDYKNKRYVLGVWENESKDGGVLYDEFITHGAKKYAYKHTEINGGDFNVTVAGLGKENGAAWYKECANFKTGSTVDVGDSGRTLSVWRDEPIHTIVVNGCEIETASSCAVFETSYTLDYGRDYRSLLNEKQIFLK